LAKLKKKKEKKKAIAIQLLFSSGWTLAETGEKNNNLTVSIDTGKQARKFRLLMTEGKPPVTIANMLTF